MLMNAVFYSANDLELVQVVNPFAKSSRYVNLVLVYSQLMKSSTIDVEFFLYRISVNNVDDQTSTIPPSLLLSDYIL